MRTISLTVDYEPNLLLQLTFKLLISQRIALVSFMIFILFKQSFSFSDTDVTFLLREKLQNKSACASSEGKRTVNVTEKYN